MPLRSDPQSVSENSRSFSTHKYSFWTYVIVFAIVHTGSHISLFARHDLSVSDYYLPTALAIVLIHWVGPKVVLPVVYFNAVCTSYLWGNSIERWPLWFLFGIPETLFAFLSWYLFRVLFHGKYWLSDIYNTVLFLFLGVFIPAIVETFLLQSLLLWLGAQGASTFWSYVGSNLLSEFAATFCLTLPALYYLTPFLKKKGVLYESHAEILPNRLPTKNEIIELALIFVIMLALVFLIEFTKFWYVYGFFSLYVAIRLGFGPSVICNLYILLITYILPKLFTGFGKNDVGDYTDVNSIFLGANFLFVFAAVTGRVISDVRVAEMKLTKQNTELEQTNEELDHFVYSVSHDLSAPLKSILGLVNISRITDEPLEHKNNLNRIEKSVVKLEAFISEILDYSRNKRQHVIVEEISLKELCDEIIDNLRYIAEFNSIQVDVRLHETQILQDKTRLKIILHNLLENAVKFQKRFAGHRPFIKISSRSVNEYILIEIEDNGEGIKSDQQNLIFDMFYRGSVHSNGSGLGLYIAKEAATKIHGNITVKSEYGKGSTFTLILKNLRGK